MIVTNVAKFRLYCDSEQARLFDELMLTYRDACNLVSEYAFSMRLYTNTAVLNKQLYDTIRYRFNLIENGTLKNRWLIHNSIILLFSMENCLFDGPKESDPLRKYPFGSKK